MPEDKDAAEARSRQEAEQLEARARVAVPDGTGILAHPIVSAIDVEYVRPPFEVVRMYSHPQDPSVGPSGAAEDTDQLESGAPSAGDDAQPVHGTAAAAGRRPSHVSALLAEIARAMQAAAAQERERIHAGVGEEEALQVEKVRARATAESAALRKGADDDVRQVESWCEEQIRQIHAEAERRVADRRVELERSVTQHGSLIETEVQSVHVAVQGYRGTLDEFFARMAGESDPSAIAGLAGTLPDPPDLDGVRADARSRAMKALEEQESAQGDLVTGGDSAAAQLAIASDVDPVPVMDPEAAAASQDPAPGEEPVPVMDPEATTSPQDSVAFRVIRSLASRTPPPQAQR